MDRRLLRVGLRVRDSENSAMLGTVVGATLAEYVSVKWDTQPPGVLFEAVPNSWVECAEDASSVYRSARCGQMMGGVMQLCELHLGMTKQLFPQGWSYYPGDTCKHGTYVGGCGADYMCGACEMGD
jgi:hypothetical protein